MIVTDKNHLPLIHKRKQYIEVPLPMSCSLLYKLWMRLKGILLSPLYLVMASIAGAPGIGVHLRCVATGASTIKGLISNERPDASEEVKRDSRLKERKKYD